MHDSYLPSRRKVLQGTLAGSLAALARPVRAQQTERRPRVAVVMTVFTFRSHAHVILENFLSPYLFNGRRTEPGVDVVAFYVDQFPAGDMARGVAKQFGIPIYDSIDKALCLGGEQLGVDAVLSIGEHGSYPTNELGQREYPRKRFFDEIVAVMRRSNRSVPVFNDKHLSYRWDWAKAMYDTARTLEVPLMAGSCVPLAQRIPPLELPEGGQLESAVSVHGGGVESYDFHALEVLQSMVEARRGGEVGVRRVQFLPREATLSAIERGEIDGRLLRAAMRAELPDDAAIDPLREHCHAIQLEYVDGFRAAAVKLGHSSTRWNFACRLKGEQQLRACRFYVGPWNNRNLFKALSHAIQHHFRHGAPPYPVERTLLVSGVLDAAMHSRKSGGQWLATPELQFAYAPRDFRAMREMGDSWRIITEHTPEPKGLHGGRFADGR